MEEITSNNPLIPEGDKETAEFQAFKEWAGEVELADMITDNIDDPLQQKFVAMISWQSFEAGHEVGSSVED